MRWGVQLFVGYNWWGTLMGENVSGLFAEDDICRGRCPCGWREAQWLCLTTL